MVWSGHKSGYIEMENLVVDNVDTVSLLLSNWSCVKTKKKNLQECDIQWVKICLVR